MFNGMMLASRPQNIVNAIISLDQPATWVLITEEFGGVAPTSPVRVTLTIEAGVNLQGAPALDLRSLPAGSSIRIVNLGNIYGLGGAGGDGKDIDSETNE